jgi:hypothetical protein
MRLRAETTRGDNMSIKLITVKNEVDDLTDRFEGKLSLEDAQTYVGGPVELVFLPVGPFTPDEFAPDGAQMFVNENGLLVSFAINMIASGMASRQIVGPALIFTGEHKWD